MPRLWSSYDDAQLEDGIRNRQAVLNRINKRHDELTDNERWLYTTYSQDISDMHRALVLRAREAEEETA